MVTTQHKPLFFPQSVVTAQKSGEKGVDGDELVDLFDVDVMDYKISDTHFKWYSSFFIRCWFCTLAGRSCISGKHSML